MMLFEVMAKDPHYRAWNGDSIKASEIQGKIEALGRHEILIWEETVFIGSSKNIHTCASMLRTQ